MGSEKEGWQGKELVPLITILIKFWNYIDSLYYKIDIMFIRWENQSCEKQGKNSSDWIWFYKWYSFQPYETLYHVGTKHMQTSLT